MSSLPANIRLPFVKVFSALVVFFLTVHSADAILSSELSGDTLLLFAKSAAYALLKKNICIMLIMKWVVIDRFNNLIVSPDLILYNILCGKFPYILDLKNQWPDRNIS